MTYPGGKNGSGVYQQIINHMPPHTFYIEPFLGGGAIMRMKKWARSSIGIDADSEVTRQWQNIHTPKGHTLDIVCDDALRWLALRDFTPDTLIYCDPPYLPHTRSNKKIYKHEMTESDHLRLLEIIKSLKCMVIISGWYSITYAERLKGWSTHSFTAQTRGGRHLKEWIWYNFPPPTELHDYRYLGRNFRERERIKRKKARWLEKLRNMKPLERYALLDAFEMFRAGQVPTSEAQVLPGQHPPEMAMPTSAAS
jgi:hypothetical protein